MTSQSGVSSEARAVVGLLSGLLGVVLLVFVGLQLQDTVESDRALKTAVDCPSVPREPSDCLWRQPFTVSGIHLWSGSRSKGIHATLTPPGGSPWPTEFRNDGPVLFQLHDGDEVTGTIWRGQLVRISAKGARQATVNSPDTLPESRMALLVVCGPSCLLMALACGWRLRRIGEPQWGRGMKYLLALAVGLAVAGVVAAVLTIKMALPLWSMPAIWLVPAALMTALAIAGGRQPAQTDLAPSAQ
ncbi:hypothetical protein [Streptomyces sp. NPDC046805]|uniref:hypothetical protein n=1 Tax=Streptomyces sp. NPDC046805 TaxID=3155134 RepID=UPI003401712A